MDDTIGTANPVGQPSHAKPASDTTGNLSSHKKQDSGKGGSDKGSSITDRLHSEPPKHASHSSVATSTNKDNGNSMTPILSQDTSPSERTAINNGKPALERVVYDVEHLATFSTNGGHQIPDKTSTTATVPQNKSVATGISVNDDESNNHNNVDFHRGEARFDGPDRAGELDERRQSDDETTPKIALRRLFELEKLSGIWTQRMQIELREDFMFIIDCETNSVVERFSKTCVSTAEAFNHHNDIYNNIVVFIIKQLETDRKEKETQANTSPDVPDHNHSDRTQFNNLQKSDKDCDYKSGELHIFQCVSHQAQELVNNILDWKSQPATISSMTSNTMNCPVIKAEDDHERSLQNKNEVNGYSKEALTNRSDGRLSITNQSSKVMNEKLKVMPPAMNGSNSSGGKPMVTMTSCSSSSENSPIVNVNVKETVQVFNQIAALREKGNSKPTSPTNHSRPLSENLLTRAHSPATNGPKPPSIDSQLASPGGQLYKQRSIRATLAPKGGLNDAGSGSSNDQSPSTGALKLDSSAPSSSSGASTSGSSSNPTNHKSQQRQQREMAASDVQSRLTSANSSSSNSSSRSSKGSGHPTNGHYQYQQNHRDSNKTAPNRGAQQKNQLDGAKARTSPQAHLEQVSTNESYVSVLNHCFDDIEKFIIRLQQSMAASHELQVKKKLAKRAAAVPLPSEARTADRDEQQYGQPSINNSNSNGNKLPANGSPGISAAEIAALSAKAREPSEEDYFEIMSKFKLAFNLLAKLKGCIHEPNAPELVHFLFTPLAIIIESARNASPPIDPALVGIPYLNQDALDLLSNCCTSKECDMWNSLGPNWTQTIDTNLLKVSRLPSSFQPIFSDGWAPIIRELELIGLTGPSLAMNAEDARSKRRNQELRRNAHSTPYYLDDPIANYPLPDQRHPISNRFVMPPRGGKLNSKEPKRHREASLNHRLMLNHSALDVAHPSYSSHQLNSVPYDYPVDDAVLAPELDTMHHPMSKLGPTKTQMTQQQRLAHQRGLRPELSMDGQQARRLRQHARANYGYGLDAQMPYETSQYPPMSLTRSSAPDDDEYPGHPGGPLNYSDDYTEVQEPYARNEPRGGVPNPGQVHGRSRIDGSHARHRRSASTGRQPLSSGLKNSHLLYPGSRMAHQQQPYDLMADADHEAMLHDLGPAQTEWFYELQARGAIMVRVLFTRSANNDKELSVRRGEILEVLDDTRKWWRARNIDLQEAHVPHTIVAVMDGYQTLNELLTSSQDNLPLDNSKERYARRDMQVDHASYQQQQWQMRDSGKRSSTAAAGAFRYF